MNKRLVVLGSTGMLGHEVTKAGNAAGVKTLQISRKGAMSFVAGTENFADLAEKLGLCPSDWLVNCIGWIPQKSTGNSELDNFNARLLNVELVASIARAQQSMGFNWIQIQTDCVFSGSKGCYLENDIQDPVDLYGKTKAEGEEFSKNAIRIRCSIVGVGAAKNPGLFSWFRDSAKSLTHVQGYTDHIWNGVSAHAFAKLCTGILKNSFTMTVNHNWIPKDKVTKFELLSIFGKYLGVPPSFIEPHKAGVVDRSLATSNQNLNLKLWNIAGYESVPSIDFLCQEFILGQGVLGK